MKDGKLVAAQIGCGAFAREQNLPNMTALGGVEIRYCCDTDSAAAEKAASKFGGGRALADYRPALDDPELDFVAVATPHDMHKPIVLEAAKRGKHVFCEKPMAMTLEDCWEMIAAVRRAGIKFCVDLNRRMSPAMHALKARVLGQQREERHNPWRYIEKKRPPMAEELATNFLIRIQDESSSYRLQHIDPMHGGGQVLGETVHWLDLACWFFDTQRPVRLTGWGSSRLSHGINLEFSGGDAATIIFDVCGTFDYPKEMYEVTSRAALFKSLFFVENRYYGMPGVAVETFPLQYDSFADAVPGDGFEALMKKGELRHGDDAKANWGAMCVDKGHRAMIAGFMDAIRNGTPSPCDEMAGMRSLLLAQIAVKAIKTGHSMPVPVEDWEPVFV
ncbi:MAG: Gfo/Idh/MocA family oxidoreductase [Kiritimatiellae bacterium]|nr:Gfo/Idh/MocA family oxidoreductase [Kiritimatiellia bacterium]